MKATSSSEVSTGSFLVSRRATATMGPNSPTVPMAETNEPNLVSQTPASRRMGTSVPSAVVVRARPTTTVSSARPADTRAKAAAKPMASDTPHPAAASLRGRPRIFSRSSS